MWRILRFAASSSAMRMVSSVFSFPGFSKNYHEHTSFHVQNAGELGKLRRSLEGKSTIDKVRLIRRMGLPIEQISLQLAIPDQNLHHRDGERHP